MRAVFLAALVACGGGEATPDAGIDSDTPDVVATSDADLIFSGTVTGRVVAGGMPVPGATVKFGGRPEAVISQADGTFALAVDQPVRLDQLALTAGKVGYQSGGVRVDDPAAPQEIEITALFTFDDPTYVFKSPDAAQAAPYCIHCHPHQYEGWSQSEHAEAARDAQLHDLYNGTALGFADPAACAAAGGQWRAGKAWGVAGAAFKCYVDDGLLADLNPGACGGPAQPTCDDPAAAPPADPGVCADCHAPASDLHVAGGTNLNEVSGIAFEKGVHCDFCHKIRSVTVNERPGVNGAIELLRPPPPTSIWSDPEVFFGPYSDVIIFFMGGSPQPQFRTSEICSGCHQWSEPGFRPADKPLIDPVKWPDGLPIQDTWHEWSLTPQAAAGVQCQQCHEPGMPWETGTLDLAGLLPEPYGIRGWPREYGEVRAHTFAARQGPLEPGMVEAPGDVSRVLLRDPISVAVEPARTAGQVSVTVRLTNGGAAHSIPSGTPSRSLILLVRAEALGAPLPAIGGYTVPAWTGAYVDGVLGPGESALIGDQLTLPAGAAWPADLAPGAVVRFVQPSGAYADYPGNRWFADPARTAVEKGMEIVEPIEEAAVVAAAGDTVTLDRALALPDGTAFHAGSPAPAAGSLSVDAEVPVTALAGAPGWAFGKVMRDRDGRDGVFFFRAVDIASDNRIPAGQTAVTTHVFDTTPAGAAPITVSVALLYRKHTWFTARARGWAAVDVPRLITTVTVP